MKFNPHPYQQEAIRRLLMNSHYGLFLDMGLGKTVVTLTAVEKLMNDYCLVSRVLIIAPKTVAESTWQDEAGKWDHLSETRFSTVLGTEQQRIRALERKADCYVINRENVVWLCEHYRYRLPFDMLVIDESSSFKNPQAKRFKALRKCRSCFDRIVILTGTPAPNTLMDLWPQLYLLDSGEALGKTLTQYRTRYFTPDRMKGHVVYSYRLKNPDCERAIYDRIQSICMSLKAKDYLTLPERIDNVVPVRMAEPEKRLYKKLEREQVLQISETEITASSAAVLSTKLLQLANGCIYDDEKGVVPVHTAKLDKLKEITEENEGKPILVFYAYQHDRDRLLDAFGDAVLLQGSAEMQRWNRGEIPMLLAHPASAAYGLNLQAGGNIIVWYGLTWSLEQYQQANARLYRQGQDKPVIIHHLVTVGTMDEQVMTALQHKNAGQEKLMEAVKAKILETLTNEK